MEEWIRKVQERHTQEQKGRIQEEDRWHPEPPSNAEPYDGGCEWPLRTCVDLNLPCNRCPYHQEQY